LVDALLLLVDALPPPLLLVDALLLLLPLVDPLLLVGLESCGVVVGCGRRSPLMLCVK
jgi:hypothetical protein